MKYQAVLDSSFFALLSNSNFGGNSSKTVTPSSGRTWKFFIVSEIKTDNWKSLKFWSLGKCVWEEVHWVQHLRIITLKPLKLDQSCRNYILGKYHWRLWYFSVAKNWLYGRRAFNNFIPVIIYAKIIDDFWPTIIFCQEIINRQSCGQIKWNLFWSQMRFSCFKKKIIWLLKNVVFALKVVSFTRLPIFTRAENFKVSIKQIDNFTRKNSAACSKHRRERTVSAKQKYFRHKRLRGEKICCSLWPTYFSLSFPPTFCVGKTSHT